MECDEAKLEEAQNQNSEKWRKQVLNLKFNFLQFLLSSVHKYKLTLDIFTQSSVLDDSEIVQLRCDV